MDLGEANAWEDVSDVFCAKGCYARSEWVLRWVLSDQEVEAGEGKGKGGVLGGKWEKLTSQRDWSEIELLEDIEREAGVEFGEDAGSVLKDAVDSSQVLNDDRKAAASNGARTRMRRRSRVSQTSSATSPSSSAPKAPPP